MPTIKVWCLPEDGKTETSQRALEKLHQAIVAAAVGITELGLKDETDLAVLFPPDLMRYGLGTEIVIEIEMFAKPERTQAVRQLFAATVGAIVKSFYPTSRVSCGPIKVFDPKEEGFWESP